MKKVLTLVVAFAVAFSLSTPAFAKKDEKKEAAATSKGKAHKKHVLRDLRHDFVATPNRREPVLPAAVAQVPWRRAMALEPHAQHRMAHVSQPQAKGFQFGRRCQQAMHENHARL